MRSVTVTPVSKILSAVLLVIILTSPAPAQSPSDTLILTKEQNEDWISRLDKATKATKLEMIKARLLMDTNVYVPQKYADRIKIDHDKLRGTRVEGCCKPGLIISGHYIDINNNTKAPYIKQLTLYLDEKTIDTISILTDAKAAALYGSRASYGVIIMTTKKKKILRRILTMDMHN